MAREADYLNSIKYRKLDENDDYMIGMQGELLTGLEAMSQAIKTRLRTIKGEWFQGDATALPYFYDILGNKVSKDELDLQIITRIMDTVGVLGITDVVSSIDKQVTEKPSAFDPGFELNKDRLNVERLREYMFRENKSRSGKRYHFACKVKTVYGTTTAEVIR